VREEVVESVLADSVLNAGGDVGAGGASGTGLNNHAARPPPATMPAPAAIAMATVSPAESVVVTVVAAVMGGVTPPIDTEVGVKISASGG
jgi:hypothetical protein